MVRPVNQRLLLRVTAPAILVGLLLLAACVAGVWYINRLQTSLADVLNENVISSQAAQELEIRVRQLFSQPTLFDGPSAGPTRADCGGPAAL
jgi:hypothetical protein